MVEGAVVLMGDRGQVYIKDTKVYLYTHWDASNLAENVEKAVAKGWRWNDPDYLARIIFDVMTKGEQGGETGFGIGTQKHGDIWLLVTVDCKKQTVTVSEEHYIGGTSTWTTKSRKTFPEIKNHGCVN